MFAVTRVGVLFLLCGLRFLLCGLRARNAARLVATVLLAVALAGAPGAASAQGGLFSPAITVNEQVVTGYELDQRIALLRALSAPGDPTALARRQLIDNRLQLQAARDAGIRITEEEVMDGIGEFASRADLTAEQFIAELERAGIAPQTVRDFIRPQLAWRNFVQGRFAPLSRVDDDEVDRALSAEGGGSTVRVLLSEIVMPVTPATEAEIRQRAERIATLTSIDAFAEQARRFSATPSRQNGGRLEWRELETLPPALQPLLLGLRPGQVTDPLPLQGAIALFQLRDIEETAFRPTTVAAVEYATLALPGGRSAETLAEARAIAARLDRCDDLYGVARDLPEDRLSRTTLPPAEIEDDIATALATLDPGEVSLAVTRDDGQTLLLTMLCGRSAEIDEEVDRQSLTQGLRGQRLEAQAEGYLAQLRAEARIVEQ